MCKIPLSNISILQEKICSSMAIIISTKESSYKFQPEITSNLVVCNSNQLAKTINIVIYETLLSSIVVMIWMIDKYNSKMLQQFLLKREISAFQKTLSKCKSSF